MGQFLGNTFKMTSEKQPLLNDSNNSSYYAVDSTDEELSHVRVSIHPVAVNGGVSGPSTQEYDDIDGLDTYRFYRFG